MSDEKMRVRVTDSKQAILKAYKEHLTDINQKLAAMQTTDVIAEKKKVQIAVETAIGVKPESIEDQVLKLNKSVDKTLADVLDSIMERKQQFEQINQAVEAKKAELKEVYDIETEANTLAALVNAQNERKLEVEDEIAEQLKGANEKAQELVKAAEEKSKQINEQLAQIQKETAIKRQREEEEYKYNFEREKRKNIDAMNDHLSKMAKSLDGRQAELEAREARANELSETVIALQKELETLKATKQTEIEAAADAAKKSAERSAAISENIVKRSHESELKIKDAEIINLKSHEQDLKTRIEKLQSSLEDANGKVQEVAMTALRSQAEASRPLVVNGMEQSNGKK